MANVITPKRIKRRLMLPALSLVAVVAGIGAEIVPQQQYRHIRTYGSRDGIHTPKILNRRAATTAMGTGDFPWGIGTPAGVATDLRGGVWITDSGTASVHVFDAGGGYREIRKAGDDVLRQPSGIVADAAGRMYIADAETGNIFVFDEKGDFDHPLIPRKAGRLLETPVNLTLANNGATIFVVDSGQPRVVALNREGEVLERFSLPPQLTQPTSISVVNNQLYILGNFRHIVGEFSPSGKFRSEFQWDGIRATGAFAFDARRHQYFVVDARLMLVQVFAEDGTSLGSFGQRGESVDQMQRVDTIHVDTHGQVYLVDTLHGKVLVFSAEK